MVAVRYQAAGSWRPTTGALRASDKKPVRMLSWASSLATAAGPIAWNAILRTTHASQFFTDAPVAVLPASWQDTGSGVALATTAVLAGGGATGRRPGAAHDRLAALCGLAAFLVDVYLY
jgi:hypothetical protein